MSINAADTAWMLISTALVMLMTPGLALFYGGMVRSKNVLSTIMMSFMSLGVIGILWALYGYSLAFGTDWGGIIGGLDYIGLRNVGQAPSPLYAPTVPHLAFMIFQMMFAVITVALITGAVVERVKFSAIVIFSIALVYPGLPSGSSLGLGRRLVGQAGSPGFCRWNGSPYHSWCIRFCDGFPAGSP